MSEQTINYEVKYQQLLRDLKVIVEGLLVGQISNVWFVYGGLNRLHNAFEKIFKHGCKIVSLDSSSDYWQFIQGLEWLCPTSSNSYLGIDSEYKSHVPQNIKSDKASIWLYRSLESHSLSQKLCWLLTDKAHLKSCYQPHAFLCQQKYTEAVLIYLRAVERSQPSLMSEIDPCLFVSKTNARESHKSHRRCSSFPDRHFKCSSRARDTSYSRSKTLDVIDCRDRKLDKDCLPRLNKEKALQGRLKLWHSMPDLAIRSLVVESANKSANTSRTTPSTPVYSRRPFFEQKFVALPPLKSSNIKNHRSKNKRLEKREKHVIISNVDIIEHTPSPSSSIYKNSALNEELVNLSVKSLPETKSPLRKSNLGRSAPDYGFLSALSGEKDYKKQPKKTFIEDGGMSVLPMATGYFPRPTKGQTLTSFLTSGQFARTNAELDRENAHFSISEAMISAIEQIRCKRDWKLSEEHIEESDEEIIHLKQRIRLRRRQKLEEKHIKLLSNSLLSDGKTDTTTTSVSPCSTASGTSGSLSSEEIDDLELEEASNLVDNKGVSMSMASLYSGADLFRKPRGAPDGASDVLSAEGVALSLISRFNEKQLPRASDLEWLVSEEDAPQALLPLPKSWPISPDDSEEPSLTPLRGTREWAPPRPQIIFTPHPRPDTCFCKMACCCGCSDRRKKIMAKQNYRCAGCGMRVASQYASRFRYCDYLGRYFCTGCHNNQLALIPGRILQKWDFTRTQECLENEPTYLFTDPDVYSMQDLINIRSGEMKNRLKYLVEVCCRHTAECELCLARGFICQICSTNEVIFPWQLKKIARCKQCGSCFHIKCWNSRETPCVRCTRINKRKESISSTI